MYRLFIILILLIASCTSVREATFKAEEAHYALYKQKALIVYDVTNTKVLFMNPACTRCYFLKGQEYLSRWEAGDTMLIDSNLTDFYNLRFAKCL